MALTLIKWSDDLSTGIDWQDKQHKALIKCCYDLHQALENKKTRTQVVKCLDFLDQYVKIHFAQEEKFMSDYVYPNRERHIKEHLYFINRLKKLRSMVTDTRKILLGLRIHHDLNTWIINHIKVSDKKLGEFLKS